MKCRIFAKDTCLLLQDKTACGMNQSKLNPSLGSHFACSKANAKITEANFPKDILQHLWHLLKGTLKNVGQGVPGGSVG